ncbi:hypothetical protein VL14_05115 [Cytobacillus firmus]|nr:hypothetical protein VL14_05115 [Cytobacillus firmus]
MSFQGLFSLSAGVLCGFFACAAGFGLWIGLFCFLCLKLARVLTLMLLFLLSVSEVGAGSDSGAPLSPFCVRIWPGF